MTHLSHPVRVLLVMLGAVAVLLVMIPAQASAAPAEKPAVTAAIGDCKDAPMPANPMGNPLAPSKPHNASKRDPFAKDSDATIAQVYGNGYGWVTYDNGCKPGDGMLPGAVTGISNMGIEFSSTWVAWGRNFQTSVLTPDSWIGKADPTIAKATKSVADGFWFPWLPVSLLVVAGLVMWRSKDGAIANVVTGLGWSFIVLVVVSWAVNYPSEATKMLDDGVATATTTIGNSFSGEAADEPEEVSVEDEKRIAKGDAPKEKDKGAAALSAMETQWDEVDRSTSYQTWLTGTFGDADSKAAKKHGPAIFKSTHFTWEERDEYREDPEGEGKKIVERKQKAFEKAADKVKEEDPIAYDYLTGNRYMERLGASITGAVVTAICVAFLFLASLGLAAAYVVIRLIVPFAPAAGPIFMIDPVRNFALDKMKMVASLLVMGPLYLVTGLVVLKINSAILGTSDLGLVWKIFVIAIVGWVAWKLTKPSAFGGRGFGVGRMIRQAAATAAGVRAGSGKKADGDGDEDEPSQGHQERNPQPYRKASRRDQPVHESPGRGLPPGPTTRADSHDLGDIPNSSYPVSEGVFVPREPRGGGLPSRRESLALPVGSSPVDDSNHGEARPSSTSGPTLAADDGRVRPFVSSPTAPDEPYDADTGGNERFRSLYGVEDEAGGEAHRPIGDERVRSLPGVSGETVHPSRERPQLVEDESGGHTTGGVIDGASTSESLMSGEQDRPVEDSGDRAASGRVLENREDMPTDVHEANYTVDPETGRQVFAVYRPRRSSDV